MFKIFYPVKALGLKPFCLQARDVKAVLSDPDNEQNSVLVLEPNVIYDMAGGGFYERILVRISVLDALIYLNSNENN